MADSNVVLYALLVGIDSYADPAVPTLRGCVNDVTVMRRVLQERFGVADDRIVTLTNEQGTARAIEDAFRRHLIGTATAWAGSGGQEPKPAFLFHYSGHGSQAISTSPSEPDGMDETLVAYDSRTPGIFDIKDKQLGAWLDELTAHTDNVTVILDCCHSGSGTRALDQISPDVAVRWCPPDLRPQPPVPERAGDGAMRSLATASGWDVGERYVLLAGCRDFETSKEYKSPVGQHGAMSYFLLEQLEQMSGDRVLTYRELHERVRTAVNHLFADQMPQCEGDRDRTLFGGLRPRRDPFYMVEEKSEGYHWIDGGMVHGLTEGTRLAVYAPDTRTLAEAGAPIATLVIEEIGAVRSGCTVVEAGVIVPVGARAVVTELKFATRRVVELDLPDAPTRQALQTKIETDEAEYLVLHEGTGKVDFRVRLVGGRLQIQDQAGTRLVASFAPDDLEGVTHDLAHLALFYNRFELRNTDASSDLVDAVSVRVCRLGFDEVTQEPKSLPVEPSPGGEIVVETAEPLVIEVTNHSTEPLYVAIFDFSYDWSVSQLYPKRAGANEALAPGKTLSLGLSARKREQIVASLPEEIAEARQRVKVIATANPTEFGFMNMDALKVTEKDARRALTHPPASASDEWITAELEFRLVQPQETLTQRLVGGQRTALPAFEVAVEPPDGFQGKVRVLTARQSTRDAESVGDLRPPAGLAPFPTLFAQARLPSTTRDVESDGTIIEIEADDEARRLVTPGTPLAVHVPPEMTQDGSTLMVLAFDGTIFYPVGRPGEAANTVNVEWLPDATTGGVAAQEGERDLGRTVKLYVYKLLHWEEPSLGLRRARWVPNEKVAQQPALPEERVQRLDRGEVRYRDIRPGEMQRGDRVALFVHGFTSDTPWMLAGPAEFLAQHGFAYDHLLTFDYESFSTHIADNGKRLAAGLRAAGFGPDDGIHLDVFAHSMGTVVTRALVELAGGDQFVDRCFLAGTPNQGTILAEAKRLVPWLTTIALNQVGTTPPGMVAAWALKKVTDDAVGVEDLRPTSEFYKELNRGDRAATVPYFLLAGRNELPPAAQGRWQRVVRAFQRGTDAALDFIFKDQNDMVINVRSMQTVRNGVYPPDLLKAVVIPCNHFNYFSSAEGQAQLRSWLSGG